MCLCVCLCAVCPRDRGFTFSSRGGLCYRAEREPNGRTLSWYDARSRCQSLHYQSGLFTVEHQNEVFTIANDLKNSVS